MQHFRILADKLESGFFGCCKQNAVFNGGKGCRQRGVGTKKMGRGNGPGGNNTFNHDLIAQSVYDIHTQFAFQ